MKKLIAVVAVAAFTASLTPMAIAGPQQERMKACNADAAKKELKGDARKDFMKLCLSGKTAEAAQPEAEKAAATPQQQRMKACNTEAGEKQLKGDARKQFMGKCLKG